MTLLALSLVSPAWPFHVFCLPSCFFAGDKGHGMATPMQCDLNFRRRGGRQHWQLLLVTGTGSDNDTKLHFHPVSQSASEAVSKATRQQKAAATTTPTRTNFATVAGKTAATVAAAAHKMPTGWLATGNRLEREQERKRDPRREGDPSAKLRERPSGEQVEAKLGTKCWGLIQRQTAAKLKEAAAAPVATCRFPLATCQLPVQCQAAQR